MMYFKIMRRLYIISYDITDSKRLNRVRYFLKCYSTGGQKSVYECFLTNTEITKIVDRLDEMIENEEDRIHIFAFDGRIRTYALGIALQPKDPSFFYFG